MLSEARREFLLVVWRFLLSRPNAGVLLSALTAPDRGTRNVKDSWQQLLVGENVSKSKKPGFLKVVLSSRPDLFRVFPGHNGHPQVSLMEGAWALDPSHGLPESVPELLGTGQLPDDTFHDFNATVQALESIDPEAAGRALEAGLADLESVVQGDGEWDATEFVDSETAAVNAALDVAIYTAREAVNATPKAMASRQKRPLDGARMPVTKAPKTSQYHRRVGVNPWTCEWTQRFGYRDVIWTPVRQKQVEDERRQETRFIWAAYEAIKRTGGRGFQVSQLGADFEVARQKKEPQFKQVPLMHILHRYEELFTISQESGCVVLVDGAEEYLPDMDEQLAAELSTRGCQGGQLPDRVLHPVTARQRMQALRVELIHAIDRRGGRTDVTNLGQDHLVKAAKEVVSKGQKMIDLIRMFSTNFNVIQDAGQVGLIVELTSVDVSDESAIDIAIAKSTPRPGYGGKKSFGAGRYNINNASFRQPQIVLPPQVAFPAAFGSPYGFFMSG